MLAVFSRLVMWRLVWLVWYAVVTSLHLAWLHQAPALDTPLVQQHCPVALPHLGGCCVMVLVYYPPAHSLLSAWIDRMRLHCSVDNTRSDSTNSGCCPSPVKQ